MIDTHDIDYWNVDESLVRFIHTCHKNNIGYLALLVCIAGDIDPQESLHTFCGIQYKPHSYTPRKGTVPLDIIKLREVLREKGITQKAMSQMMGVTQVYISRTIYECRKRGYVNNNKRFVDKLEKLLNLPKGALIKKEDKHGRLGKERP